MKTPNIYSGVVDISTQFNDIPSISTTIWYSGCKLDCPGCHNTNLECFQNGYTYSELFTELERRKSFTKWLVLLGGNPLDTFYSCIKIAKRAKDMGYKTFLYSGYTLSEIKDKYNASEINQILLSFDYIKTGRYDCTKLRDKYNNNYYFESVNQEVYKIQNNDFKSYYSYDNNNDLFILK